MPEFTFAERMRTAHVSRWQIVRTARVQTLAEHLYLSRVITLEMCDLVGFPETFTTVAERWALEHDVPEVKTGDLATPVKAAMRAAVPDGDPVRTIELSYSDSYAALYRLVKNDLPHVRALVKMADTLEAILFLDTEGMGEHATEVGHTLRKAFNSQIATAMVAWPEYRWIKVHSLLPTPKKE